MSGKKETKAYVWTAVGITKTGRKFYFYHLSLKKDADTLFAFNTDLL